MEGTIATIIGFAGNFAPRNWAFCSGQLLPIAQNTALFSIIGTTYGGDGRTTMALPDARGRTIIGEGTGPGLSPKPLGQKGGQEAVTLNVTQIPSHNHTAMLHGETANASSNNPTNNMLARNNVPANKPYAPPVAAANQTMGLDSITVSNTGGNQSHENMMPWLSIYYVICLVGVFPSRS